MGRFGFRQGDSIKLHVPKKGQIYAPGYWPQLLLNCFFVNVCDGCQTKLQYFLHIVTIHNITRGKKTPVIFSIIY